MIKLAVFDWNGTLLADFAAVHEGCNRILEVLGHPAISEQEFREVYAIPLQHVFRTLHIPDETIKQKGVEGTRAFHDYYEPRVARAHTRTGARAALAELKRQGIPCVILSNHTMEGIYLQLERLKLRDYFETVLANEDINGAMRSGKQHRLEAYMKNSHILPSEAMIIGDTVEEIHIGQHIGLKTVAITGGYHATKKLRAAKPDLIINSLHGIIENMEDL